MANNVNAAVIAIVEDEPIHEIYASLVGISHRKCVAVSHPESVRCAAATIGVIDLTSPNIDNPDIHSANQEADVITNNCDDCRPVPSSSQFISFYRKSCREAQSCWGGNVKRGGKQKFDHQSCSRDTPSSSQSGYLKSEISSENNNIGAH